MVAEAWEGTDWAGRPFTTLSELTGFDDQGAYRTTVKGQHKRGDPKGGKLKGQTVSYQSEGRGSLDWEQSPSFLLSQARGVTPIQVQNLIGYLAGETDGFDALTKSLGLMTSGSKPRGDDFAPPAIVKMRESLKVYREALSEGETQKSQRKLLQDAQASIRLLRRMEDENPKKSQRDEMVKIADQANAAVENPAVVERLPFVERRRQIEDQFLAAFADDLDEDERRTAIIHQAARIFMGDTRAGAKKNLDALTVSTGGWSKYYKANQEKEDLDKKINTFIGSRLREMAELRGRYEVLKGAEKKAAFDALQQVSSPYGGWPSVYKTFQNKQEWRYKTTSRKQGYKKGDRKIDVWIKQAMAELQAERAAALNKGVH
jgi:hypothetical protein